MRLPTTPLEKRDGAGKIGEGIAFAGLCLAASWLEASGHSAAGLWLLVVLWAFTF